MEGKPSCKHACNNSVQHNVTLDLVSRDAITNHHVSCNTKSANEVVQVSK